MQTNEIRFENAPKYTHDKVLAMISASSPQGPVMDIPSGSGAFARRLAEKGHNVIAADVVNSGDIAGVEFHQADMNEPLPAEDGSIACISCIEGIEHLERPFDFVRECHRVLSDDGILILTTPNTSAIRSRWRYFLTGFHNKCKYALDETTPNPLHHINMLSFPALRYMLHSSSFQIEAIETNRIKGINWLYLPMVPIQYLVTSIVNRRAKPIDISQPLSKEVLQQMMSLPLLFGESMVIAARKT